MATYPYVSGAGALVSAIERLGKQFAGVVTADTLEQLGIAPVRRAQHPCRPSAPRPRAVDDGHDAQTTSEALKFLDEEVQRISSLKEIGRELMMAAFNENNPKLALNILAAAHEQNEQEGFKYLFAGTQVGIRNPWGHESGVVDGPATCLDHRSSASKLLRRLDTAGLT